MRTRRWPVPGAVGGVLAAYLLIPLLLFLGTAAAGAIPPGGPSGPGIGAALGVSALTATVAVAVIAGFGVPLAYWLARSGSRWVTALGIAVQLPIALPPLVSGLLLLSVVGPYGPLGRLTGGRLTDDLAGIVLAQVFVAAPFLIVTARSAFAALDPALDDVAATLGLRPWARLLRVAVPAAGSGVAAGLGLAWLRAFGEFGATVVLAYHPYSLPVFTWVQFGSGGLSATTAPVLLTLAAAAAALAVTAGARHLAGRSRPARLPAPVRPVSPGGGTLTFDVTARTGGFTVTAAAPPTTRLAVVGRSGAGKTLLLRALAGVTAPVTGTVRCGPEELTGRPPWERAVGYVPQDPALPPTREVWRQVVLGERSDPAAAAWWLRRLDLEGLADRFPAQLSGGQRRRVALARALASRPRLLLLDEPFTGLDVVAREALRRDLRRIQQEAAIPTVIVSHDPADAAALSERVLLLDAGQVVATGSFEALRRHPPSADAARLLGLANVHAGVVAGPDAVRAGATTLPADTRGLPPGSAVTWHLPPHAVQVRGGGVPAAVADLVDWGSHVEWTARLPGGLELRVDTPTRPARDGRVAIDWEPDAVRVWPAAGVQSLAGQVHRP